MLLWNGRPNDVADYSDRTLALRLGALGMGGVSRCQFGNGRAALKDDYLFFGRLHPVE